MIYCFSNDLKNKTGRTVLKRLRGQKKYWAGLNRTEQDWTWLNKTEQDRTGLTRTEMHTIPIISSKPETKQYNNNKKALFRRLRLRWRSLKNRMKISHGWIFFGRCCQGDLNSGLPRDKQVCTYLINYTNERRRENAENFLPRKFIYIIEVKGIRIERF